MDVESASSPEVEILEESNGQKSPTEVKKRGTKKRKKKGANEPQKPVSAYALFFRDTQAAIKQEQPGATFGEISKIVASMWDSLSEDAKLVYKGKTEKAKRDYLKQLASFRANLVSRGGLDADEDDTTPLSLLKLKMTGLSPNPHKDLPPPPKLQMAPIAVRGIQIQHQPGCTPQDVSLDPNMVQNVSCSDESRDSQPITSAESSPSIPSVQHIVLRSVPAPNLPPIQLRNIVPKPHPTVTLLQSKSGQVIKLLPSSQASSIAQMSGGQNRIIKMSDLIRNNNALTSQPSNMMEDNVQPILQTLAQEHETCLQDEDFPMNGMQHHVEAVSSASQPTVTAVASVHPNLELNTCSVRMCVREGCLNPAIPDPQWDHEFCCSQCGVDYTQKVFDDWAAVRQVSASVN